MQSHSYARPGIPQGTTFMFGERTSVGDFGETGNHVTEVYIPEFSDRSEESNDLSLLQGLRTTFYKVCNTKLNIFKYLIKQKC